MTPDLRTRVVKCAEVDGGIFARFCELYQILYVKIALNDINTFAASYLNTQGLSNASNLTFCHRNFFNFFSTPCI
jgi:hypothetical protein